MTGFEHVPHPHVQARRLAGPVKVADQLTTNSAYARFNTRVALGTTKFVGSMNCAWVFAAISLVSLPAAIASRNVITIVGWVAQTFLQLVLLSVIMVGQNVQAAASDARSIATFEDAEALLHNQDQVARHLTAQDAVMADALDQIRQLRADLAHPTNPGSTP